jgi:hypothetical protein
MSRENVELVRSLVREEDLVQLFREDPDRRAAARTASEPHFHPDFECLRHDLPGG